MTSQSIARNKTITCQYCGKVFEIPFRLSETAKYCSRRCRNGAGGKAIARLKLEQRPKKNCAQCGKEFSVNKAREKRANFCSISCASKNRKAIADENTIKKCVHCGVEKPLDNFYKMARAKYGVANICKPCNTEYRREWVERNPDHEFLTKKLWRNKNPELRDAIAVRYNQRLRAQILENYGGKCACCGETQPEFLAIDHIFNDGAKCRKEHGSGRRFYVWLKRNGFPKDRFQLLCHNCNMAKSLYGICPHQTLILNFSETVTTMDSPFST